MIMHRESIRDWLLITLATRYEEDPQQFVTLSKRTLDSSLARGMVAELRNEGYVQEQVRGVIRMTPRGYMEYRSESSLNFRETEAPAFVF
jgi:Mn-dependent DtxR family transcriptional regulator